MPNPSSSSPTPVPEPSGSSFQRGGQRLTVSKMADRFTVRLKRGADAQSLAASHNLRQRQTLGRGPNLDLFSVDSSERDRSMDQIRQDPSVEFASHVYQFENDQGSRIFLTDEITVQFQPDLSDDDIEKMATEAGLQLVKPVPGMPRAFVFRLTPQAKENPIKIANRLLATGRVMISEPNIVVPAQTFYVPTDSMFAEQWHLSHAGGPFLAADSHVDAIRAWDVTRGDRAIVVAVADDSVDTNHVDFSGAGKIVSPRDLAGNDFEPLPVATDDNHGTSCAGVAVAEENGAGVVGAAPGCALMPIRTSGFLDDNSIEDLFDWVVQHGASVVSCSWGPSAINFPLSTRQANAIHRAATLGRNGRGCVIVFAAGNANRPVNGSVNETGWPSGGFSGSTRWHGGFAAHPDVVTVAACTSLATKSAYSNWGDEISVCAPSNNAHPGLGRVPTYPLVSTSLSGLGIVTTDRVGSPGYSSTDYTRRFGGTSSACPLVAGVAGLILSANPELTAREVKQVLEGTADKITDTFTDPQLGNAFGTYNANGHSRWFGFGKINAFRAVQEAVRRRSPAPTQTLRKVSTPGRAIPDHNSTGIRDIIHVAESGTISALKVHMDITHTYRGDLRLTLIAPSGRSFLLQESSGDDADNVQGTFDSTSAPALSGLANESILGDWTLLVQDLASLDLGQLNRWELEIEVRTNASVELQESPGVVIPDNKPAGIERSLSTAADGRVQSVEVSVDITHTYIRDLTVSLVSPAGKVAVLHQRDGGSAHDVKKTYTPATTPDVQALRGEGIQGNWRLNIADLEARDEGRLNRWTLKITRQP